MTIETTAIFITLVIGDVISTVTAFTVAIILSMVVALLMVNAFLYKD